MTTVLLELAPKNRAVSKTGRNAYATRIAIHRDKLIEDGHSPARAQRLTQLCTSAIQGALIQSRIERSGKPIVCAAEELAQMFYATS